jgi:hypothetical protein
MTGAQLKADGIAAVLAADTAVHRDYADLVRESVEWWGEAGQRFSAEDVRVYIGLRYPDAQPHSPNVLPAVLGSLAAAGRIEAVGHTRCTRSSRRHGWMRVWRLTPPAGLPPAAGVEEAVAGGEQHPAPTRPAGP